MRYAEKLKDPRWQKKRLQILDRDGWACTYCHDDTDTLHVHHISYSESGDPWDVRDEDLKTLCEKCHLLEEHIKGAELKIKQVCKKEEGGVVTLICLLSLRKHGFTWGIYTISDGEISDETIIPYYIFQNMTLMDAKQRDCLLGLPALPSPPSGYLSLAT